MGKSMAQLETFILLIVMEAAAQVWSVFPSPADSLRVKQPASVLFRRCHPSPAHSSYWSMFSSTCHVVPLTASSAVPVISLSRIHTAHFLCQSVCADQPKIFSLLTCVGSIFL